MGEGTGMANRREGKRRAANSGKRGDHREAQVAFPGMSIYRIINPEKWC